MRLAYLYSRYPVLSQTFCDMEMLELERRGFELIIGSIHSPLTSLRHAHLAHLRAPIQYAPPSSILRIWEKKAKQNGRWPQTLIEAHERQYGPHFKAALRARNALYFADLFRREGADHCHVHFANRAAHTALFLKQLAGIPFSVTAHGQDFMADLGQDDLLAEICAAAEFVAAETDYSRDLLRKRCPESAAKIHRVYNGIDLTNFRTVTVASNSTAPARILSVGRLVAFKGFSCLIEACAHLKSQQLDFSCHIVGDGPLREELQARISELQLEGVVTLRGSLTQAEVFEELKNCDIFALASTTDRAGASDVFPTVIQEAMATARPVVSTRLAGIPETVLDGETGLLVTPDDVAALTGALKTLLRDRDMRLRFGAAGRARIEQHFQIQTTVAPLIDLFERSSAISTTRSHTTSVLEKNQIGYIIDVWPDERSPMLDCELLALERRRVPVVAFVCRTPANLRFSAAMEQVAPRLIFLPDAMAIEAEWQVNRNLAQALENDRANEEHRAPADIFLQQARFAIALRKLVSEKNVSHLHATSSRALICGLMLKKMLRLSLSVTIEANPALSRPVIESVLEKCVGGRISDRKLNGRFGNRFIVEPKLSKLMRMIGIGLTRSNDFWQEWAEQLERWSRASAV